MLWRNSAEGRSAFGGDILISTYSYDANGNRIAKITPFSADSGTYDAQDRLLNYSSAQYSYTRNGELQKKIEGTDTTTYAYDNFGNLVNVRFANGDLIEYLVDGQNRRVGKKLNGQIVKRWIYSGQLSPIAELDSAGNVVSQFVGSLMIKNGNTYQLVTDHLGSVRLVVDVNSGAVTQQIDYDEFGNTLSNTNPDFQPFAYAGGLYDTQTKLVRFGARDYDASVGRWTMKDPIGFGGGVSNFYEYVVNDPIQFLDPSGLQFTKEQVKIYLAKKAFEEATGIPIPGRADVFGTNLLGKGPISYIGGAFWLMMTNPEVIGEPVDAKNWMAWQDYYKAELEKAIDDYLAGRNKPTSCPINTSTTAADATGVHR
jgi:RHS repeat-associated protein